MMNIETTMYPIKENNEIFMNASFVLSSHSPKASNFVRVNYLK